MVRHEHVRIYLAAVLLARGQKAVTKEPIVRVDGETRATIVPTLDDVLRESRRGVAGQAGHRWLLAQAEQDDTHHSAHPWYAFIAFGVD
jgi:hypothetical protein